MRSAIVIMVLCVHGFMAHFLVTSQMAVAGGLDKPVTQTPTTTADRLPSGLSANAASPQAGNKNINPPAQEDATRVQIPAYTAEYQSSYNGLPLETTRTLTRHDGQLHMIIAAKNFLGSIIEEESFLLDNQGSFRPINYEYQMNILGKKRKESLTVDRNTGTATALRKKQTSQIPSALEYFGPLSYQHQLQQDLLNSRSELSYTVIYRGRLKEYIYQRTGHESIETPLGTLDTLKLIRQREESDRETILWVAPTLNYLPVKLFQKEENGETYEMTLTSYKITSR